MIRSNQIRVLFVNDHKIFCQGIRLLFKNHPLIEVLYDEGNKSVVQLVNELQPDVIVTDINISSDDSITVLRQILEENPDIGIVANSDRIHIYLLSQAIKAGVTGFILNECGFDELVSAIKTVHQGETYMCHQIKDILARGYLSKVQSDNQEDSSIITEKEYEVIQRLSEGMTSKAIALDMELSSKTVDAYRRQIMNKLEIRSIAELTKYAIREGITSI